MFRNKQKSTSTNLLKPHFEFLAAMCVGFIDGEAKVNI